MGVPQLCIIVSISQHYFWLSAFAWMSTICYYTWRTFSSLKRGRGFPNGNASRCRETCAPWLAVGVFVGACVGFAWLAPSVAGIAYGSSTECFLRRGVVYYFAVPLCLSVTVNAALFSATVSRIRETVANSKRVRPAQLKADRASLSIYVRLSTLMGFTWLFGVAANLFSPLWYAFISVNTLQGVFVCASFAFSTAARKLWRAKFAHCTSYITGRKPKSPKTSEKLLFTSEK